MTDHALAQQAYRLGFLRAAEWAKRDDLPSDVGSPAYLKDMAADLSALSRPAEGDGWMLVPTLPTEEMLRSVLDTGLYHNGEDAARAVLIDEYREMLNAAPPPPTAGRGAECRKCSGAMRPGVAIEQTYSAGAPDFPGDTHGVTISPAGPGQLIDCSKCEACGWSVTAGSGEKGR